MAIDKALYGAPVGILEEAPPVEIEIENPDAVSIGIGDLEIDLMPQEETADDFDVQIEWNPNNHGGVYKSYECFLMF